MRHYYIQLIHGAMLVLATSAEEARGIAGITDEHEIQSGPTPLPDVTMVTNDNGFEWYDAINPRGI